MLNEKEVTVNRKIPLIILLLILVPVALYSGRFIVNKSGQMTPEGGKAKKQEETGKLVSLKEALTLGQSILCTYTAEDGEVTTWVKGEKVRVEGTGFGSAGGKGDVGGMINDGEWVYIWGEEDKSGMKYKLTDFQKEESGEDVGGWADPEKWAEEADENYVVDCKNVLVTDSKFVPPSDIEFSDLSGMFKKVE